MRLRRIARARELSGDVLNKGEKQMENYKKCGRCHQYKPATSEHFNIDNTHSSGFQSWCKDCARKAYLERRSNGSVDLPTGNQQEDELVELYLMAYLEGYNRSTLKRYGGKIREAKAYALQVCPQADKAIRAYGQVMGNRGKVETPEQKLGVKITSGIRQLQLKEKFYLKEKFNNNKLTPSESPPPPSTPAENVSISEKYCNWLEQNDFVPNDVPLAYFTGVSRGAFVNGRRKLTDQGYILEQVEFGWKVTKRPTKGKTIEEMSKEEVVILLKKLLG